VHCELERCVKDLGFVGCLLNPDPTEGEEQAPPGLGDRFWYPLYEKLVELDVPALIHSTSSCDPRESYTLKFINEESIAIVSLLDSAVFDDFPTLKLVVSHGGGAIPYQMGRFRAWAVRRRQRPFDEQIRRLYFDTCNYSAEALDFQLRILGVDNCLFGTERPGTGTILCGHTGRDFDDLKPAIESIAWLTAEDRHKIFEGKLSQGLHACISIYLFKRSAGCTRPALMEAPDAHKTRQRIDVQGRGGSAHGKGAAALLDPWLSPRGDTAGRQWSGPCIASRRAPRGLAKP